MILRPRLRSVAISIGLLLIVLAFAGCARPEAPHVIDEQVIRHNILGTAYLGQQKWSEAENAFDLALEQSPGAALLLNNKAVALIQQGRIDEAESLLRQALESEPDNVYAHYNLGTILKNRGDFEPAVAHFELIESSDPDDVMTHYNLGMVYSRVGRDDDAEAQYRRALELDPTHVSSLYALGRLLLQGGDQEQGVEFITRSQEIRARSGLDEAVGSQYGEQGPYAMGADYPGDALAAPPEGAIAFEAGGFAGLPGPSIRSFALGLDAQGELPTFLLVDELGAIHRYDGTGLSAGWPADGPVLAIATGDLDNDGRIEPIALVAEPGGLRARVVTPDGGSRPLAPAFELTAPAEGAALTVVDLDHDGDLDLFFCWSRSTDADCAIGTSDGAGSFDIRSAAEHGFRPSAGESRPGPLTVAFSDVDNDRDVDLLLAQPGRIDVFANQRDGSFLEVSDDAGLGAAVSDTTGSMQIADVNKDGQMDLVVATTGGARFMLNDRGRFTPGESFGGQAGRVVVFDYDNDGFLDLALTGEDGVVLHRNLGAGQWDLEGLPVAGQVAGRVEPAAALDPDADGDLDLVALGPSSVELLENRSDGAHRFILIRSRGVGDNRDGIGAKVEILAGALRQKFEIGDPLPLHVGLGPRDRVETVRYIWPSGVLQDEIDLPAGNRVEVSQLDRKGTSCPLLYAWRDGGWHFVTDFLGGSAVGYLHAPDVYSVPDTDEYVKIEGGLDAAGDGTLRLRVNNQLQEVIWFDRLELVVVDHPRGTEVYPDERLMPSPPFAGWGLFASEDVRPIRRATSVEDGEDLTDRLARADRRFVDDFELRAFKGYATDHTIELDLGEAIPRDRRLVLLLDGWIDYADSSANLAAYQAGVHLTPPVLTVAGGRGDWIATGHRMGFPAGLPKTMAVDLSGLFPTDDLRVRIATNMRIYWDRARVMIGGEEVELGVRRLPARVANLEFGGFPLPSSPDGRPPFGYDPDRVTSRSPWTVHVGRYTAFGDVGGRLAATDDRLVTTRSGDQIELRFADPGAPAPGHERTYLLFAEGFGKDMDPNSAANLQVGPIPFHAMPVYPYPDGVYPPVSEEDPAERPGRIVLDSRRGTPGALPQILAATRDE